jgi:hypothetical protein
VNTPEQAAPEVPEPYKKLDQQVRDSLGVGLNDLEPVKPAEVALSAKKGCRRCFGKGAFTVLGKGGDADKQVKLCDCGLLRFVKTHHQELVQIGDRLFWKPRKPGAEPTVGDATRMAALLDGGTLEQALKELGLSEK